MADIINSEITLHGKWCNFTGTSSTIAHAIHSSCFQETLKHNWLVDYCWDEITAQLPFIAFGDVQTIYPWLSDHGQRNVMNWRILLFPIFQSQSDLCLVQRLWTFNQFRLDQMRTLEWQSGWFIMQSLFFSVGVKTRLISSTVFDAYF